MNPLEDTVVIETTHAVASVYRFAHRIMMSPDVEQDSVTFFLEIPTGKRLEAKELEMDGLATNLDAFAVRLVERAVEYAEAQGNLGRFRFSVRAQPLPERLEFVLDVRDELDEDESGSKEQGEYADDHGRLLSILERDQDERIEQSKFLRSAAAVLLAQGAKALHAFALAVGPVVANAVQNYVGHTAQPPPATEPAPVPPPAESAARETGGSPS